MFNWSQHNFAHVTTVYLIGSVYFKLEHSKFSSNLTFDRNIVSETGARSDGMNQTGLRSREISENLKISVTAKGERLSGFPRRGVWSLMDGFMGNISQEFRCWWSKHCKHVFRSNFCSNYPIESEFHLLWNACRIVSDRFIMFKLWTHYC